MIRIVRTPEGLRVDPTGKIPGRGAYLHDHRNCWESGLKGALNHALNVELTEADHETLRTFMETLPAGENLPAGDNLPAVENLLAGENLPRVVSPAGRGTLPEGKRGNKILREENKLGKAL